MKNKIFVCVLITFVLIVVRSAFGQSIVLSTEGRSIVLSTSNQPVVVAAEQPTVVVDRPAVVVDKPAVVVEKPATANKQWYLVSESWCRHCPAAKQRFLRKGWSEKNVITIAEAKSRFGVTVASVPYEFEATVDVVLPAVQPRPQPARYIQWPGWGTIDLETYNRNCNCGMCQNIRAKQQEYQRQLREWQTSALPDDQQPCPHETVEQMLDLMKLTSSDTLADLGCGDGRILIAAARRGIRGIGVELDPKRADVARRAVDSAKVSHLVAIETGDARKFKSARATAITAYLYPTLLAELAETMRAARVVASPYHAVPGLNMVQYGDVWIYNRI